MHGLLGHGTLCWDGCVWFWQAWLGMVQGSWHRALCVTRSMVHACACHHDFLSNVCAAARSDLMSSKFSICGACAVHKEPDGDACNTPTASSWCSGEAGCGWCLLLCTWEGCASKAQSAAVPQVSLALSFSASSLLLLCSGMCNMCCAATAQLPLSSRTSCPKLLKSGCVIDVVLMFSSNFRSLPSVFVGLARRWRLSINIQTV